MQTARLAGEVPHSIVIADDDFATRSILVQIFRFLHYHVTAVEDGREAYAVIRETRPDIALLDLYMPNMDGREVLKKLKSEPSTTDIPIVVLTTISRPQVLSDVMSMGALEVICKPFDLDDLVKKVTLQDSRR